MPGDSRQPALPAAPVRPQPDNRSRSVSTFSTLFVLTVGLLAALALAGTAAAASGATPCGKKVLADWFDNGRVDRIYPLNCYEEAIDAIPEDLRDYADAEDVITRALQYALRGDIAPGGKDPSPTGSGNNGGTNNGTNGGEDDPTGSGDPPQAAPDVDTSGPSSVPIPLLVLGGLSLALLAAGGLGYLSRRRQATETTEPGAGDDVDPLS